MPKSKKNKIVHLTQVKKKSKDHREDLMKQLEGYIRQYEYVFVFDFDSTKSDRIMNLRLKMKQHGSIFAGRNSIVALAMKTIGTKTRTNYKKFLKHITGHRGLLFTNLACDKLIKLLEANHSEFRDKLLGYAPLKVANDTKGANSDEEDDEDDDDDDKKSSKRKRKMKPEKNIRFMPIKRTQKKKGKELSGTDTDGDIVLADANDDDDDDDDDDEEVEDDD